MYGEARSALRKALNLLAESGAIDVWRLWVCLKIFRTWGIHAQCMAILMVNIMIKKKIHAQMAMF
jgi:hypothetical protein